MDWQEDMCTHVQLKKKVIESTCYSIFTFFRRKNTSLCYSIRIKRHLLQSIWDCAISKSACKQPDQHKYIAIDIGQLATSRQQPYHHKNSRKRRKNRQSTTSKNEIKSDLADFTHHSRISRSEYADEKSRRSTSKWSRSKTC